MVGDADQDVGEIGFWIESVQLAEPSRVSEQLFSAVVLKHRSSETNPCIPNGKKTAK